MSILNDKILRIDYGKETKKISTMMKSYLRKVAHRRGFVVAISGGIDSSVCAALAVNAVGKDRVLLLRLPEAESSTKTGDRSQDLAHYLGCETIEQNITNVLEALGCYEWRDNAIKEIFPEYAKNWKSKIVIVGGLEGQYNHFELVVQNPDDETMTKRLEYRQYLQIVAATNYKQRIRKSIEYFHADRMNYAVVGTPNFIEYNQGFYVKNGDDSADVKPIAHLYKSQVYGMAHDLGLPENVCDARPTTDTYSLPQGQDEFYFGLPYQEMDAALWSYNHDLPVDQLAQDLSITKGQAEYVYKDIR